MRFVDTKTTANCAAAKDARCQQLLSEGLNHGWDYDGVMVVNTFVYKVIHLLFL